MNEHRYIAESERLPKYDALRQGQLFRVINGYGLPAHIRFPGVGPAFAAASGFFFSAKGSADLCAPRADIDVGDTAIAAAARQKLLRFPEVIGKDCRT